MEKVIELKAYSPILLRKYYGQVGYKDDKSSYICTTVFLLETKNHSQSTEIPHIES